MRISDWSSDVCSSDLRPDQRPRPRAWLPAGRLDRRAVAHRTEAASRESPRRRQAIHARACRGDARVREAGHPDLRLRQQHPPDGLRSEEHTSELQSLMRISYAVFCLKKKTRTNCHYLTTDI